MNSQLTRIINLLNENGYEVRGQGIDESNAYEAVDIVLAQMVDASQTNDSMAGMAEHYETTISMLKGRIAELERMESALRPVGVMSQAAYQRLENRESRFIALCPRPEIYLPRKRPEDGVIVYARTAGNVEAD